MSIKMIRNASFTTLVALLPAFMIVANIEQASSATVAKTTDGSSTTSGSTPTSATNPTENITTTTSKPIAIIESIPTLDFSLLSKKKSEPKVVTSCNKNDICSSMNGFCIKGTCKTKECSTEIYCVCDPGFTGHICDKNITEIELKIGKGNGNGNGNGKSNGNGKPETSSTATLVNVNKGSVSENLTNTPNAEKNKETLKSAASNKSLGKEQIKTTSSTHKTLVNGKLHNVMKASLESVKPINDMKGQGAKESSMKKKFVSDQTIPAPKQNDLSSVKSTTTLAPKKIETTSKPNEKVLANGDINFNLINTKHDSFDDRNNVSSANNDIRNKELMSNNKGIFIGDGSKSVSLKEKDVTKMSSDGSYVKGPELHVATEHSVVDISAQRSEINRKKSSLVKELADVVTISTTSIEQKQLGKAPEMLTSGARDSLVRTKMKQKQTKNKNKNSNPFLKRNVSSKKSSIKTTKRKTLLNETVKNKSPLKIVSSIDILDRNAVTVNEDAGSINVLNNSVSEVNPVMEVSPLLANSEIKITIETSNADLSRDNETTSKDFVKLSNTSSSIEGQDKSTFKNNINTAFGESDIQGKAEFKNKVVLAETFETAAKREKIVTSGGKTDTNEPSKKVGPDLSLKSRESKILTPIMQLMNIFRSEKFVENVSAVKIEIITKQNNTDYQRSSQNKQTGQTSSSNDGEKPS